MDQVEVQVEVNAEQREPLVQWSEVPAEAQQPQRLRTWVEKPPHPQEDPHS